MSEVFKGMLTGLLIGNFAFAGGYIGWLIAKFFGLIP